MIRRLDWDSAHFQLRIGRVEGGIPEVSRDFDCLYFLAGAGDRAAHERSRELGFVEMGERVQLTSKGWSARSGAEVRPAQHQELDQLAAIEFPGTRFSLDSHFPRERVASMYRAWIEKLIATTFVVKAHDAIAGYVACEKEERRMRIALIAVAESFRGRGVGAALLDAAGLFATQHGMEELIVTTQGSNQAALHLYRRYGFREISRELWFHWWQE